MQPPKPNEPRPRYLQIVRSPKKKGKLPGHLANVPDNELVAMCFAGIELVERVSKKIDPWEVVNTCFVQLCDNYPWDPKKGPLKKHFLVLVTNELHLIRKAGSPDTRERQRAHAEAYYAHTHSRPVPSPEDVVIADEAQRVYDHNRARRRVLIERVRQRVAGTPAEALFDYWVNATEDLQMTEVAEKLGLDVTQLYSAKKMIEYHARACRKEMEGE